MYGGRKQIKINICLEEIPGAALRVSVVNKYNPSHHVWKDESNDVTMQFNIVFQERYLYENL